MGEIALGFGGLLMSLSVLVFILTRGRSPLTLAAMMMGLSLFVLGLAASMAGVQ